VCVDLLASELARIAGIDQAEGGECLHIGLRWHDLVEQRLPGTASEFERRRHGKCNW